MVAKPRRTTLGGSRCNCFTKEGVNLKLPLASCLSTILTEARRRLNDNNRNTESGMGERERGSWNSTLGTMECGRKL
ncbi:hypothetical protein Lser_V15G13788 [Lactuca serriola]